MTPVALAAGVPPRDRLEQIGLVAIVGLAAATQLSIAVSQVLLGVAVLCWLVSHVAHRDRIEAPGFFWPLVVYAVLTLAAAGFSPDPRASFIDCKQLVLLLIVPVVYDFARGARANTILAVILTAGAVSALVGIVQYGVLDYDNLGRRPLGTLSHWMTYSGTLMLVICAAVARLLFGAHGRLWAAVIMPALFVSVLLTFTRSAWVGVATGVGVLCLSKDLRLVAIVPIVAASVIGLAPAALTDRMYSMFDMNDPTNRDRIAMLQTGVAIIGDHPLTGVGPNQIERVYPRYRMPDAVQASNPHLHNVPMQVAAERGLPALAAWAWFAVATLAGLVALQRRGRHVSLAAAGVGAMAAMLAAGLFEYNFGDSEFQMLLLVIITLPFAANRDGGLPA